MWAATRDAALLAVEAAARCGNRRTIVVVVVVAAVYDAVKQASHIYSKGTIANIHCGCHNGDSLPAVEIRVEHPAHTQLHAKRLTCLIANGAAEAREIDVGHRRRRVIYIARRIVAENAYREMRVDLIGYTARHAEVIVEVTVDVVFIAR